MARWLLILAAHLLPAGRRDEWRREWEAEIAYRVRRGAGLRQLLANVWRDLRLAYREADESLFRRPFVAELALFVPALLLFFIVYSGVRSSKPSASEQGLVVVQRSFAGFGALLPFVNPRVLEALRTEGPFENLAVFRVRLDGTPAVFVSRNFFQVMETQAHLGRTLDETSDARTAVITHAYWRSEFRADPAITGKTVWIDDRLYKVGGVLPEGFVFLSPRIRYFALAAPNRTAGAIARLKNGVTIEQGQAALRQILKALDPAWKEDAFRIAPWIRTAAWWEAVPRGLGAALAAFACGGLFLLLNRRFGRSYYGYLGARLALSLLAVSHVFWVLEQLALRQLWPVTILNFWFFFAACLILAVFTIRDHAGRCPDCWKPLRMPAQLGLWSSVLVDAPATEYVCPDGHGLLYVPDSGDARPRWTQLDASWRDLFSRK